MDVEAGGVEASRRTDAGADRAVCRKYQFHALSITRPVDAGGRDGWSFSTIAAPGAGAGKTAQTPFGAGAESALEGCRQRVRVGVGGRSARALPRRVVRRAWVSVGLGIGAADDTCTSIIAERGRMRGASVARVVGVVAMR